MEKLESAKSRIWIAATIILSVLLVCLAVAYGLEHFRNNAIIATVIATL
ncbi:hypothetical protein AGMMS50229_10030 [Campylobacterota bacterium]|nr:hypothetical protein AGMMS50229_10030 [Campylobacterota bacterium]